jgi:hypothetical protein
MKLSPQLAATRFSVPAAVSSAGVDVSDFASLVLEN